MGITQTQLAELTGIHSVSIRKYETNKMQPQINVLKKLAVVFQISLDDLCSDSEPEEREEIILKKMSSLFDSIKKDFLDFKKEVEELAEIIKEIEGLKYDDFNTKKAIAEFLEMGIIPQANSEIDSQIIEDDVPDE